MNIFLLLSTFTLAFAQQKFATFSKARQNELITLAANGKNGNVAFNGLLKYDEFHGLGQKAGELPSETVEYFHKLVDQLDQKIHNFMAENINFDFEKAANGGVPKHLQTLVECKKFMVELVSAGGEGAILDLATFIYAEHYKQTLGRIYECSKVQSAKLDEAIRHEMLQQHQRALGNGTAQPNTEGEEKHQFRRVLIEGAGPAGLYSAFRLFLIGCQVTLVNDRLEYTRNRLIYLDIKWMAELRWFLGTKFNGLFVEEKRIGGRVIVRELEQRMRQQLQQLADHFNGHSNNSHPKLAAIAHREPQHAVPITLNYGVTLKGIEQSEKDHLYYGQMEVSEKGKGIVQLTNGKTQFDLLILAGGANDRLRDRILGSKTESTLSKEKYNIVEYYGDIVLHKKERVFTDKLITYEWKIQQQMEYLLEQNIDALIQQTLPREFIQKYLEKSLIERLTEGRPRKLLIVVNEYDFVHIGCELPDAFMELLEGIEALRREAKERGEKNVGANGKNKNKYLWLVVAQQYANLRKQIERKWFAAIFAWMKNVPDQKGRLPTDLFVDMNIQINIDSQGKPGENKENAKQLNFDPHPVNTSTFGLQMTAARESAIMLQGAINNQKKAIVAAVGDANASPHFMTGSGLVVARLGIEKFVSILKKYHNPQQQEPDQQNKHIHANGNNLVPAGKTSAAEKLVHRLNEVLKSVAKHALEKARKYVAGRYGAEKMQTDKF